MGWVKRLADHVTQDRLGEPDLEFVWAEGRPGDPAVEAKIIDTYVRSGIYAINEARDLLGLDPVPGGDRPMVYGTQGSGAAGRGCRWKYQQEAIVQRFRTCPRRIFA